MNITSKQSIHPVLLWLCLSVVIITPFANDACIAAFPTMQQLFHTNHINWVISFYLAGLAVSQLIYGPLSDRFGRKPVLVVGLSLFLLASSMTLFTSQFSWFLIARFIQAVGACSTIISVFAIIRDTTELEQLARPMGVIMAIIGVCPTVAPLIGSLLTVSFGWKGSFTFLLLLGVFYLCIIIAFLKETHHHKNIHALQIQKIILNYKTLFINPIYIHACIISAFAYGILFTYISLSPHYIVEQFHYSIISLGWIVFFMGLIIVMTSLLVPKLCALKGDTYTLICGSTGIVLGSSIMAISQLIYGTNIFTFTLPMAIIILGIGFIRSTASISAMKQADKKTAGSAASGFNLFAFGGGSICSAASSWLIGSPLYFSIFSLVLSAIATHRLIALRVKQTTAC